MVAFFVLFYTAIMIGIGVLAARRVKNSEDYVLAGRSLPFYMALSTVFATWFGSESILGAGSKFAEGGLSNVVEDPFGAALCLIIVGLFFNRKLYRLNYLTIGDYFKHRYNSTIATFLSIVIIISYFGWVAAQFLALGVVLHAVIPALSIVTWIFIAAGVVSLYTILGGMISIALHDTMQTAIIIVGLSVILISLLPLAGGATNLIQSLPEGHLDLFPKTDSIVAWTVFLTALMTQGFGSIPQQDIYQRAMSARNEKESMYASVLGGVLYFIIIIIPFLIASIAAQVYPNLVQENSQLLIPTLIKEHSSALFQVIFFGALVSAILSTASGALLAPATLLSENVIKPFFTSIDDKFRIRIIQAGIAFITIAGIFLATNEDAHIYELVASAYSVTLVAGFAPLAFGLYSSRVNSFGAFVSIISGISVWQMAEGIGTAIPPTFLGFFASVFGIIFGSFLSRFITREEKKL